MDDKRNAILLDLWETITDIQSKEIEVAELQIESEKGYFRLKNIDTEDSKSYFKGKTEKLENIKQSVEESKKPIFEKLEKIVSKLSDEKVEEYISTFLEKI